MKALIINYNRLTLPKTMADWLAARGCDPVFVDNRSTYTPLLKYYHNDCPYQVLALPANYGHTVVWFQPVLRMLGIGPNERYIVSDSDLDLSGVPDNFLEVLNAGLNKYTGVDKCGLSLEVNDLPNTEEGFKVRTQYERNYWLHPLDAVYFDAATDTTLALYREGVTGYSHSAIRTNRPYTAKHVPWYYTDFASLSEEEKYYFTTANDSSSGKKRLIK